jgi:hypothetical protein
MGFRDNPEEAMKLDRRIKQKGGDKSRPSARKKPAMGVERKSPRGATAVPRMVDCKDDFLAADSDTQLGMVLEDFQTAYRILETGQLDRYSGQFVAFLDGRFISAGSDSVDLRMKVSQEHGVHPERVAVIHVFDEAVV